MIFKVVKAKGADGGCLGYDWIEVLASEPFALTRARTPDDYKHGLDGVSVNWAAYGVVSHYICRTEHGLHHICSMDLWHEIEAGTYCEDTPEAHEQAKKTRETLADPPWLKDNKDNECTGKPGKPGL